MKNGLIIDEWGTKSYYLNDQYHREDGPAVECVNGDKYWYKHNKCHREDGPAIEYAGNYYLNGNSWWLDGNRLDCETQEEFERLIRLKAFW